MKSEKFTGYLRDAETGLDYADQRYYQPGMGRFLTADPYMANNGGTGDSADPGSWNRYAYVGGDPVNYYDPDGLVALCPIGAISRGTYCEWPGDGDLSWLNAPRPRLGPKPVPNPRPTDGGGGPTNPQLQPQCDRSNYKNNEYLTFIDAHFEDADKIARQLDATPAEILGVAIAESGFGAGNIAANYNNFFSVHAGRAPYAGQTGTYKSQRDGLVAVFSAATGFYDSGEAFVSLESRWLSQVIADDPTTFAETIHQHGYGVGTASYVSDLVDVINNVLQRIDCPR